MFKLNFRSVFVGFKRKRNFSLSTCQSLKVSSIGLKKKKKESSQEKDEKEEKIGVCTISDCELDPCGPEPSVVIVGAGIAGLSAAHRLQQCGITNFVILEATDRPGGRVHSCWLGDVVAEMGAQYIEGGCMANPVYNLAAQEGLLKSPLSRPDPHKGLFCTTEGRAIDFHLTTAAHFIFQKIEKEATSLFCSTGSTNEHGSLLNFMNLRIQQELLHFPAENRYDLSRVLYGLMAHTTTKVGDALSQVSADNYGSLITIPGGRIRVPLGYVGVLAPLLRDLPECSIKYKKPVGLIRWGATERRNNARAIVSTCDGEEFPCDFVITTVSLGVLKNYVSKLFCPHLPVEKLDAIRRLGYGVVDKIFLDYCRPFWVKSEGGLKFAWSPMEQEARNDWTRGISSVEEVEDSKSVLCAYVTGPEALEMERASEEDVAEGVTRHLRLFTGDPSLPYPGTILRSKWGYDPYFCGSFSYMNLTSTVGQQCDLSIPVPNECGPVPPILLFAGEATCAGHFSTVHGARLSGIREAWRIVKLTKQLGGPPKCK